MVLVPLLLAAVVDAPITEVTVFSDRARVVRTAVLTDSGARSVELPTLPQSSEPQSIRVEASGAIVQRVDLNRLEDDALPTDEAKKLLADLQKVDDAIARVNGESGALDVQISNLQRFNPKAPPEENTAPPAKLNAGNWGAALTFVSDALGKAQTRRRELQEKHETLMKERQTLAEKARLLGAKQKRFGWKTTVQLSAGKPTLKVTYFVTRARWYPVYDLALNSDTGKVTVSFSGLVSQESGEDWSEAAMTLSTAVPSTQSKLPKLLTWKIGERERFIPTPTPVFEGIRPQPAVPPLPVAPKEEDVLRVKLLQVSAMDADGKFASPRKNTIDFADVSVEGDLAQPTEESFDDAKKKESNYPMAPPPPPRSRSRQQKSAAPAPAAAPEMAEPMVMATASHESAYREAEAPAPTFGFSLAPPSAYRAQTFSADLPAAAGGGYELTYTSLQKETVASGKGARKVALFSEAWPVTVERKLFPALFPEAFLVAELKNPSTQPLPAGNANLFVGDDPSGTARLKLVSPGEVFTLPLGIDRALRPVRNVKVVQSEEGLVSKDEISQYSVTIELANPYRAPLSVRMVDQIPVTQQKDVEIKLAGSKPVATQDARTGALEWRLTVPANQKTVITYSYSVKRPKGWKLHQSEVYR